MGILQARIVEWSAMLSPRGSSHLEFQSQVSLIEGGLFTVWDTKEAQELLGSLSLLWGSSQHTSQTTALQVGSLLAELPGRPFHILVISKKKIAIVFILF